MADEEIKIAVAYKPCRACKGRGVRGGWLGKACKECGGSGEDRFFITLEELASLLHKYREGS